MSVAANDNTCFCIRFFILLSLGKDKGKSLCVSLAEPFIYESTPGRNPG